MAQAKILIVEDEILVAEDVRSKLEGMGYSALPISTSGPDAIQQAQRARPDLVLMDIDLPGPMDGIEAAAHIRERCGIPVVYLTAYADSETIDRAKTTEPHGYIVKPFEQRELRSTVEIALYKHRMEEALRESEARYRSLVEHSMDGIIVVQGNLIQFANRGALKMLGCAGQDDAVGHPFTEFVSPEYRERMVQRGRQRDRGEDPPSRYEFRAMRRDGTQFDAELSVSRIVYQSGVARQGLVRDITERKAEARRRRLATRVLELLNYPSERLEVVDQILALVKQHTGFDAVGVRLREGEDFPYFVTQGFCEAFFEAETRLCCRDEAGELIRDANGEVLLACLCGNVLRRRTDPSRRFFTEGGSFWTNSTTDFLATTEEDQQIRVRDRCNREGYESVAIVPVRSGEEIIGLLHLCDKRRDRLRGEMIRFLEGIGASIGIALERLRSKASLRDSEELMRRVLDTSPDAIFVKDSEGRYVMVNAAEAQALGTTPQAMIGKTAMELVGVSLVSADDARLWAAEDREVLATRRPKRIEDRQLSGADGGCRWFRVIKVPLALRRDSKCILGVAVDITDRKRAEEALRTSREQLRALAARLQAVREDERARLARAIHDDVGHALTALKMDLAWLGRRLGRRGNRDQRDEIRRRLESMSALLDSTIQTTRETASSLRPGLLDDLGLAAAIEWELRQFESRSGIRCEHCCPGGDIQLGREGTTAVFRICQELLTNVARHAGATEVRVLLEQQAGEFVLEVRDNGCGITEEQAFSGRSLGILGMRERTLLLKGTFHIAGAVGGGTVATVRVPLAPEPEAKGD